MIRQVPRAGEKSEPFATFGRYAGPATLILSSLADGPKHGNVLPKATVLVRDGLIEAVESNDRRRPYKLTADGAVALRAHLDTQRRVADVGLRRLRSSADVG